MLCSGCRTLLAAVRGALRRRNSSSAKDINSDVFMPATFGRLEVTERAPLVNAYTTNGFVIGNDFVYGSVALLPRTMLNWKVQYGADENNRLSVMYIVCR